VWKSFRYHFLLYHFIIIIIIIIIIINIIIIIEKYLIIYSLIYTATNMNYIISRLEYFSIILIYVYYTDFWLYFESYTETRNPIMIIPDI